MAALTEVSFFLLLIILIFTPQTTQGFLAHTPALYHGGDVHVLYALSRKFKPLDYDKQWPEKFPAKEHCSRCGLCETTFISRVVDACALLPQTGMSRMPELEEKTHGRSRGSLESVENSADEGRFGVLHEPIKLAKGVGVSDAQWTGVVTSIALSMLLSQKVDAVVCIAGSESSWASPEPIIARTPEEVLRGRGVKPSLAPSLKVLDELKSDSSISRLLFCGVGCAVQAFRAVEGDLGLEKVYVLGTNCVDNSPTAAAAEDFLTKGLGIQDTKAVKGYEFMQDFKVHAKVGGLYLEKPYFCLPGTVAEPSIAQSCLSCFDYTNGLADVVVGYMGAPLDTGARMDESYQTLAVRNPAGAEMVQTALTCGRLAIEDDAKGKGKFESFVISTLRADSIVQSMIGENVKDEGLPESVGNILAFIAQKLSPTGLNFARYSIDYHILRNYLHVVREFGEDAPKQMMPKHALDIVALYDSDGEISHIQRSLVPKQKSVNKQ